MYDYDDMKSVFTPGVLLGETHFHFLAERGVIADAVARVADEGFYGAVEIADIADPMDRKRIGNIVRSAGMKLTKWMSLVLSKEGLNLSSVDEALRLKSVTRLKTLMGCAAECGAASFAVLSGPDPGPDLRDEAAERLCISLCELAEALARYQPMHLIIEPLDRGAHKNGLIGPTKEAAGLISRVRESYPNVSLSWDTAHAALCGENVLESLTACHSYMAQMHLSNAVLDLAHPDFGDHHMPTGAPGFLTVEKIADIIKQAVSVGSFGPNRPVVSIETRTPKGGDPWATEAAGQQVLKDAWEICASERAVT